jgi:diaminohydroxyphosphoribosylaminopyrimidine deaminase/5-amino-6-(5-phosphoribosylamino)uracil reductase
VQQTISTIEHRASAWSETDHRMMGRALALAAEGVGQVSPGPLVGCVIATPDGTIVGEGFYTYEKLKHAETYALEQAGTRAMGATAYVSLEPHAHHGRTPPCSDALIRAGIRRVVASIEDPNPQVSGKGFEHLKAAGVEVSIGLLVQEAAKLNEKYLYFMRTGRPFVHLKLAASLDGKIATRNGESRWITGAQSRARVHELRHENDAILIGAGTAVADDPVLTDRSGKPRRRPLVRIVLDEMLTVSAESQLVATAKAAPVVIFAGKSIDQSRVTALTSRGVEIVRDEENGRNLIAILEGLGHRSIHGLLIEGGAGVAGKLLDARLVNKVSLFLAPIIIGGREAPNAIGGAGAETLADALKLENIQITQQGDDLEITGYPKQG